MTTTPFRIGFLPLVDAALPMLAADFYPLDRSGDVFTWEPV